MNRKLRMGMIGGGKGSFMGAVHRIAANMDGLIELVCAALSSDADRAIDSGRSLFLSEDRIYTSYQQMFEKERLLPVDQRMDFVSIVTPNDAHFGPAMLALENGFHVVLEKPITLTLAEAQILEETVTKKGLLLLLAHTYSGYPMVKQARWMIRQGSLGALRKILIEYPQGWLSRQLHKGADMNKIWRTNPGISGQSGCMSDIGTHAAHLAEYVSGHKITAVCAQLNALAKGMDLDDDGNVLLRFENNVTGVLVASQMAAGEENNLKIRIYGEKAGLEWAQQDPNTLLLKWVDKPMQVLRAGTRYTDLLSDEALFNCRTPGGHPEGYLEAFANLYRNFALTVAAKIEGVAPPLHALDFPSVKEGVRGMAFVETVLASNASDTKWTSFADVTPYTELAFLNE